MSIWAGVGFQMVIILAGLQGIPTSLYEAASIDKAGKWQQFLNVTVPSLKNTLIFVIMITTLFSLRLFDQVYIMTQGGPDDCDVDGHVPGGHHRLHRRTTSARVRR